MAELQPLVMAIILIISVAGIPMLYGMLIGAKLPDMIMIIALTGFTVIFLFVLCLYFRSNKRTVKYISIVLFVMNLSLLFALYSESGSYLLATKLDNINYYTYYFYNHPNGRHSEIVSKMFHQKINKLLSETYNKSSAYYNILYGLDRYGDTPYSIGFKLERTEPSIENQQGRHYYDNYDEIIKISDNDEITLKDNLFEVLKKSDANLGLNVVQLKDNKPPFDNMTILIRYYSSRGPSYHYYGFGGSVNDPHEVNSINVHAAMELYAPGVVQPLFSHKFKLPAWPREPKWEGKKSPDKALFDTSVKTVCDQFEDQLRLR